MRFVVSNEGTIGSGAVTYKLQVAQTRPCGAGTYADVPTGDSGPFKIINSSYLVDGEATTDVTSGLTNEATTFVPGEVKDTGNTTGSVTLTRTSSRSWSSPSRRRTTWIVELELLLQAGFRFRDQHQHLLGLCGQMELSSPAM